MIVKISYKEMCMQRQQLVREKRELEMTIDKWKEELKVVKEKMRENDDYLVDQINFD